MFNFNYNYELSILARKFIIVKAYIYESKLDFKYWLNSPFKLILVAMIFAALFCINSWDVLSYGFIWFGVAIFVNKRNKNQFLVALSTSCGYLALPVCVALIFAAPFIINLESPSIALGVVTNETTGLKNLLLIWLSPVLPVLILLSITQLSVNYRVLRFVIATAVSVTTFFILIQMITGNSNALIDRGSGWLSLMVIVIFIGIALQQALYHDNQNNKALGLSLLLVALAFSIIFLTELFLILAKIRFF